MKHAAAGRFRGSVTHPAVCWSQDTIPKPDGLAGPRCGPKIERGTNEGRTLSGLVRVPFEVCVTCSPWQR
jgi:hypothetical protein